MPESATLLKKEILAQVFSCKFCEISKNTFFTEHPWATGYVRRKIKFFLILIYYRIFEAKVDMILS